MKRDPPDEGPYVVAIRSAAAEIGLDGGAAKESGLRDFFARHGVTSGEERDAWTAIVQSYFSAYKTGLDLAGWEIMHPLDAKK